MIRSGTFSEVILLGEGKAIICDDCGLIFDYVTDVRALADIKVGKLYAPPQQCCWKCFAERKQQDKTHDT